MRGWVMRIRGVVLWLPVALAVSACAQNEHHLNSMYLERHATADPTPAHFTVCHGFNCVEKSPASLSGEQWRRVAAVFQPRPKNARAERAQIARAVALIGKMVGPQTGTDAHQWTHRNLLVWPNLGDLTQVDCVDASVNTWTYMTMMERDGMFRFHRVAQLSYAGSLTDPDLRNTAVLREKDGGYFAIDASLVDYGQPPLVMPLEVWMGPWPPPTGAMEHVAAGGVGTGGAKAAICASARVPDAGRAAGTCALNETRLLRTARRPC